MNSACPGAIIAVVARLSDNYFGCRMDGFRALAKTVLLALAFPCLASTLPEDFPEIHFSINPIYDSVGFQFGHILNFRKMRPILSSYEGELMLGLGTGPGDVADRRCVNQVMGEVRRIPFESARQTAMQEGRDECYLFSNPWPFSSLDASLFDKFQRQIQDRPVVIYYSHFFWRPEHILTKTRNHLQAIFPVQEDLEIERSYRIPNWSAINPEVGQIQGRVVRASMVNLVRKSYEIIVQESTNANNFRAMSISDGDLFRYISRAMLTGRPLRIDYTRLYGPHGAFKTFLLNYRTDYRIIGVEIL